ncbi:hypothetical protein GGR53DRAFT_217793 [Hypoxylon sp. FL1150]|nr:hypothetical protein GGR53DRAFT_217793 [Hypoxylon sp. FL1150]
MNARSRVSMLLDQFHEQELARMDFSEIPYVDEQEFFTDRNTFRACRVLSAVLPMDFVEFRLFMTAPKDLPGLINITPDPDLLARLLGLGAAEELFRLVSTQLSDVTEFYAEHYLQANERPTPPHPATLYDALCALLGEPREQRDRVMRMLLEKLPRDSVVRSVEFALRVRDVLSSGACVADFPSLINVRKMNPVGFAYLVVMLLIITQKYNEGHFDSEEDN